MDKTFCRKFHGESFLIEYFLQLNWNSRIYGKKTEKGSTFPQIVDEAEKLGTETFGMFTSVFEKET